MSAPAWIVRAEIVPGCLQEITRAAAVLGHQTQTRSITRSAGGATVAVVLAVGDQEAYRDLTRIIEATPGARLTYC